MTDKEFLDIIFKYATLVKGGQLTEDERKRIIAEFNQLQGNAYSRAQKAIRDVLEISILLEDMRKNANLDNTQRLLADLQDAAVIWDASKK